MELGELITKLEQATGGGRRLDAMVAVAAQVGLPPPMGEARPYLKLPSREDECEVGMYWLVQRSGMSLRAAPPFTTSLDAAMRLVPDGWEISFYIRRTGYTKGQLLRWNDIEPFRHASTPEVEAATPALALCIAALKAREAQP